MTGNTCIHCGWALTLNGVCYNPGCPGNQITLNDHTTHPYETHKEVKSLKSLFKITGTIEIEAHESISDLIEGTKEIILEVIKDYFEDDEDIPEDKEPK